MAAPAPRRAALRPPSGLVTALGAELAQMRAAAAGRPHETLLTPETLD